MFSGNRFLKLFKQHTLQSYTGILLGLIVGFGICFLTIAFLQFVGVNNQSHNQQFLIIGIFSYALLGGIYISSAFSAFRNKEKAQAYLMIPCSTLEKFLVEFIFYPLLYLLLFPILYLVAYQLSTSFIFMIKLDFIPFDLIGESRKLLGIEGFHFENEVKIWILWVSASFSIAMAFFLGASSFKKFVMLKTLLGLVLYFGFCIWLFYYLISELGWGNYVLSSKECYLTPFGTDSGNPQTIIAFFSIWILCWGIVFSIISFLKLREKEV